MTWRDELRNIPAPQPSKDLLERILASRAAGVRVVLPVAARTVPSRRAVRYAATAAILAGVAWLGWGVVTTRSGVESELPPVWVGGGMLFIPSTAFGQERFPLTRSLRYPLIAQIQATRVRPGRWTYQGTTIGDGVFTTPQGEPRTIVIAAGNVEGQPVWVASSSMEMLDTVLVDRATLRPLRHVRPMRHARLVQQFSHDSIDELLYLGPRPNALERTLRGAAAFPDLGVGPMLVSWSPHSLEVLVQALPLTRAWRGSVYSANWVTMATRVPTFTALDLRVTGTGRVTVPAGTFDCWTLEEREGDYKSVLWVSKDQGWLVMTRHTSSDGSGKWRTEWVNETHLVAVDTLPTPPAP
jgi:hypothetical protein